MTLEPTVEVKGAIWSLFAIDFKSQEGDFSAYFYAVNTAHAMDRLEELQATGKLRQIVATQPYIEQGDKP